VKLVVSDVDGTILKPKEKQLGEEILTVIHQLTKRGILFAVASGRSYFDLVRLFKPVRNEILFISNDGATLFYKGMKLGSFPIEHKTGFEFMKDIYQYTEAEIILYGDDRIYLLPKSKEFENEMRMQSMLTDTPVQTVSCMNQISTEYLKIACYHKTEIGKQMEEYVSYWKEKLHLSYVSKNWMEFTSCGVSKATAVEKIMDLFGIRRDEILAFGDNDNDKEMLSLAGTAYAMKGAKGEIRQLCGYETEHVAETITRLCIKESEEIDLPFCQKTK